MMTSTCVLILISLDKIWGNLICHSLAHPNMSWISYKRMNSEWLTCTHLQRNGKFNFRNDFSSYYFGHLLFSFSITTNYLIPYSEDLLFTLFPDVRLVSQSRSHGMCVQPIYNYIFKEENLFTQVPLKACAAHKLLYSTEHIVISVYTIPLSGRMKFYWFFKCSLFSECVIHSYLRINNWLLNLSLRQMVERQWEEWRAFKFILKLIQFWILFWLVNIYIKEHAITFNHCIPLNPFISPQNHSFVFNSIILARQMI